MIQVLETKAQHVRDIALRMRLEEGIERVGLDKEKIIRGAVKDASYTFTAMIDNEPACMWGIYQQTMLSDTAYMWLITTPLIEKHQFVFARRSQIYLQGLKQHFNVIQGHVDARFSRSIRWLRWLGFRVYPDMNDGTFRRPFELRQS
jgi:hypothetical protein